ncbi:hypothetical protein BpHYR1_000793 [Brachionus plicatilis]|uniref:Uncharacterized protein n=1 Tax=Brachionus plicatilis TaxID=10195 RepID=A0A3M7SWC8_BRAPC|nr:hypothetical protein BpHYR1_000793 [Brachionus plicatilis]
MQYSMKIIRRTIIVKSIITVFRQTEKLNYLNLDFPKIIRKRMKIQMILSFKLINLGNILSCIENFAKNLVN